MFGDVEWKFVESKCYMGLIIVYSEMIVCGNIS